MQVLQRPVSSNVMMTSNVKQHKGLFFPRGSTVLEGLRPPHTYRRFLELFRHMVGLFGRVISSSQGLYLHRTTQHRKTRTNIHVLSGIRTHDPSNQPAKTHASDRTATVTGIKAYRKSYSSYFLGIVLKPVPTLYTSLQVTLLAILEINRL
jgi:hypothetical protein